MKPLVRTNPLETGTIRRPAQAYHPAPMLHPSPVRLAFASESTSDRRMEPSRHTAIVRLLKMWAMRVGEEGYAQRVTVDDVLADDVVEAVIRNDLLRGFDPVDSAERLKRRALDRVRDRGRGR